MMDAAGRAAEGRGRRMLVIPAIDLKGGRCVRLTQGRRRDVRIYDGDPVDMARRFAADGARMLHVVDLDGAFGEAASPNREVARRIVEAVTVPVQFGGGLRSVSDVRRVMGWGVGRVVVGTLAVEEPGVLEELVRLYGPRVAVGIDARDGLALTRGWEKRESLPAVELARGVARAGAARIVYTDVARDGMLQGVNVEQTCAVARASGLPVTASGGVSSLDDLEHLSRARASGVDSVIVGKALYERRFTLREAWLKLGTGGGR